jgi:hypothetical protein
MLAGNVVALLSPLVFIPILTYALGPQNYDWVSMKAIRRGDDKDLATAAHVDLELIPGERRNSVIAEQEEQAKLLKASKIARYLTAFMTVAFLILWPMPMYGSGYVFSKKFFTGWVRLSLRRRFARDLLMLIGCRGHLVDVLQCRHRRHLSAVGGSQDKRSHVQVHVPRHHWKESSESCCS